MLWTMATGWALALTTGTPVASAQPTSPDHVVQAPAAAPDPVLGLSDLHLHQWAHLTNGGHFYHGAADDDDLDGLGRCGTLRDTCHNTGRLGSGPACKASILRYDAAHARLGPRGPRPDRFRQGLGRDVADDIHPHLPEGISDNPAHPHEWGWPTSNSIAHQQVWEGHLQLAHDGPVVAWLAHALSCAEDGAADRSDCKAHPASADTLAAMTAYLPDPERPSVASITAALDHAPRIDGASFRQALHREAARHDVAGLNLAVVSLVHAWAACNLSMTVAEKREHGRTLVDRIGRSRLLPGERALLPPLQPTQKKQQQGYQTLACNDRLNVVQQHDAAVEWAERTPWAQIVTSPQTARDAIQQGKLAIVLSVEASGFLGTFVEYLPDQSTPDDAAVKQALRALLRESTPMVRAVQPTHMYDTAFFGAAMRDKHTLRPFGRQLWGTRLSTEDLSSYCREDALSACRPATLQRNLGLASALYGASLRTRTLGGSAFAFTTALMNPFSTLAGPPTLEALPNGRAVQALQEDAPAATAWTAQVVDNRRGMTPLGALLLQTLMDEHFAIDLSHTAERGLDHALEHLSGGGDRTRLPIFLSHTMVRSALTIPHSLAVSDAHLRKVAAFNGVIGIRSADDHMMAPWRLPSTATQRSPGSADRWFERRVAYDGCQYSLANLGVMLGRAHRLGGAVSFGTDLNGFINHSGPTGLLRPDTTVRNQCAWQMASIGSEVDTRGMAHVGLLPSVAMQLWQDAASAPADADAQAASRAIQSLFYGAENYLRMWEGRPVLQQAPRTLTPWTWTTATDGVLPELPVRASRIEHPPGTPAYTAHALYRADLRLPVQRAIEAELPYHRLEYSPTTADAPPPSGPTVLPQLPTTVGLLFGQHGYSAHYALRLREDQKNELRKGARLCEQQVWGPGRKGAPSPCAPLRALDQATRRLRRSTDDGESYKRRVYSGDINRAFSGTYAVFPQHQALQQTHLPHDRSALHISERLRHIAERAWDVAQAPWQGRDGYVCYIMDGYTASPAPGVFETYPTLFSGLMPRGDAWGLAAYNGTDTPFPDGVPVDGLTVTADGIGYDSRKPLSKREAGNACVCRLLFRLAEDESAPGELLTPFDRARLAACSTAFPDGAPR